MKGFSILLFTLSTLCAQFYFGECHSLNRQKRDDTPSPRATPDVASASWPTSDPPMSQMPRPMPPVASNLPGSGMPQMGSGGGLPSMPGGLPPMPGGGGGFGSQTDPAKFKQVIDALRARWMKIAEQFQGAVNDIKKMAPPKGGPNIPPLPPMPQNLPMPSGGNGGGSGGGGGGGGGFQLPQGPQSIPMASP